MAFKGSELALVWMTSNWLDAWYDNAALILTREVYRILTIWLLDSAGYRSILNSGYCKPPNFSDILLLLNIPPAVYGFCPTLPSLVICNQMPNFQRIPTNEFKYLDALHLKSDFTRKIWVSFGNRKYFTMELMP